MKSVSRMIRKAKKNICNKFQGIKWQINVHTKYRLRIMGVKRTTRLILKKKLSVARFGDGELNMILGVYNIGFQEYNPELSQRLESVLREAHHALLLCLPRYLDRMHGCSAQTKRFWEQWQKKDNKRIGVVQVLVRNGKGNYLFGDTQITRPYIDVTNKRYAERQFERMKLIWKGREVLIVEGEKTRLGVGNDLFSDVKSLKRVICPAENAFSNYELIKEATEKWAPREGVVLIALGPTATVLAADLSLSGIWAIDIGHIDVEYEWFLADAKEKIPINNKYTNECRDGRNPGDCVDSSYLNTIVKRIIPNKI